MISRRWLEVILVILFLIIAFITNLITSNDSMLQWAKNNFGLLLFAGIVAVGGIVWLTVQNQSSGGSSVNSGNQPPSQKNTTTGSFNNSIWVFLLFIIGLIAIVYLLRDLSSGAATPTVEKGINPSFPTLVPPSVTSSEQILVPPTSTSSVTPLSSVPPVTPSTVPIAATCSQAAGEILFTSDRDGDSEIFIMNADGSQPRQLTNNKDIDLMPRLSPNNSRIVFISQVNSLGTNNIYMMNVDGTNVEQITTESGQDPSWSPRGDEIVFTSNKDGDWEIYIMNIDTRMIRPVTDNNIDDDRPNWSPDGLSIIYNSRTELGVWDIHVVNTDGTADTVIVSNKEKNFAPVWAPDGKRIVFTSEVSGNWEIYTIASDGSDINRVTEDNKSDTDPYWSPDGNCITFVSNRTGNDDIWIIDPQGQQLQQLTDESVGDYFPSWSR